MDRTRAFPADEPMLSIGLVESSALAHLLKDESPESVARRRWGLALSGILHAIFVPLLGLVTFQATSYRQAPEIVMPRVAVTPLVAPPSPAHQKAPNTVNVSPEINLESLLPRPKIEQALVRVRSLVRWPRFHQWAPRWATSLPN